jgi:hypothetical protein
MLMSNDGGSKSKPSILNPSRGEIESGAMQIMYSPKDLNHTEELLESHSEGETDTT